MASIDVIKGTEIKLNLHIDSIGELHMTDYDWTCNIYTSPESSITMGKNNCLNNDTLIGKDDYLIPIDTGQLDPGTIKIKVTAYIPDKDFEDDLRTEIQVVNTNIRVKQ